MSTFRVKLNQGQQGRLDTTGTSIQRTVFVPGPKGTFRKLKDGDTFTDSNYYKKFTTSELSVDDAFLEVVTDDGSPYSDIPEENVFVRVYSLTLDASSTYTATANIANILSDYGNAAVALTVSTAATVTMRINSVSASTVTITSSAALTFDLNEVNAEHLSFANTATTTVAVTIIATIRSKSKT